jgi:predicted alpha/beta-fold hydrolase
MARAIQQELGWRVAALNFRGADPQLEIPRLNHAGASDDLQAVVESLPGRLYVVGFSLGANILLKGLGEGGGGERVRAACALSVPFDLGKCADHLESGWLHRLYRRYLVTTLQERAGALLRQFPGCLPLHPGQVRQLRTLRQFDAAITAPLHGFSGIEDYYFQCSSGRYLGGVRRPTLILHAQDDPFYPLPDPRTVADTCSPSIQLEVTSFGGHLGFLGARPLFWFERRVIEFLRGQEMGEKTRKEGP